MLAVLLALSASLSWGVSDFLGGLLTRRYSVWAAVAVVQPTALFGTLVVVAALGVGPPRLGSLLPPVLGGLVSAAAGLAEYEAFRISTMTLVSPIVAGSAVVPFVAGLIGGDRLAVVQLAGALLAITGIILISRGGGPGAEPAAPLGSADRVPPGHRALREGLDPGRVRAVLLALGAALGFGLLLVSFDLGGKGDPYWTVLAARSSSAIAIGAVLGVHRPQLRLPLRAVPALILAGLLLVAANTTFTLASTMGHLSVVGILGSLYPAITVACAAVLLREGLQKVQWAASATILAGVICLSVG
jgi:drug/metabolite transporter (DMT)-like permease